jgi:site-specific DNA recombinase
MTAADVRHLIDELGDIAAVLAVADPAAKAQVYADLGLQLVLDPHRKRVAVTAARVPMSVSEGGLEPPRP